MIDRLAFVAAMACAACSQPHPGAGAADSGSADTIAPDDARVETAATDGGPACVPSGGTYNCLGGTWPVCPANAQPEAPCNHSTSPCMGCSEGAGYTCDCEDAGLEPQQDAALWSCVGTEYTCQ